MRIKGAATGFYICMNKKGKLIGKVGCCNQGYGRVKDVLWVLSRMCREKSSYLIQGPSVGMGKVKVGWGT